MRALLLLTMAVFARAHEYPILPVSVELRLEGASLRARVEADAEYWIAAVLGEDGTSDSWSSETRAKAQAYLDSCLTLRSGGRLLPGRLLSARYARDPWDPPRGGRIRLLVDYGGLPSSELSGRALFYGEELPHRSEEDFRTLLSFPGRRTPLELAARAAEFSLRAQELRPPRAARVREDLLRGLAVPWQRPWTLFFLAASALLARGWPGARSASRAGAALCVVALLSGLREGVWVRVGAAAAAALAWCAALLFAELERRRVERVSESLAERLLEGRCRFAAVLLAAAGLCGLAGRTGR